MSKWKLSASALLMTGAAVLSTSGSAQLFSRAGGTMVYDSDRDMTWLADAGYARTVYEQTCGDSGSVDGKMYWHAAKIFVDNMVFAGYDDWRLPILTEADPSCDNQGVAGSFGYNCSGSELGHMFYTLLGGQARAGILDVHNENISLFQNVRSDIYWADLEFSALPFISWNFQTRDGYQNGNSKSIRLLVWPVRDGDVADIPPDPVPPVVCN